MTSKPEVDFIEGPAPTELQITDLVEGDGPEAVAGGVVDVHYVGVEFDTGEQRLYIHNPLYFDIEEAAHVIQLLLKIRAKEAGVAAKLIARSDELEALAAGVRSELNILSGWRFEEFGRDALDLVEGRLAFASEKGKLKMSRIPQDIQEQDSAAIA